MIPVSQGGCIYLGISGENLAQTQVFDFSEYVEQYGEGTLELWHRRPKDKSAEQIQIEIDGTTASWDVGTHDLEQAGFGTAEFMYYTESKLIKSPLIKTKIEATIPRRDK